MFPSTDLQGLWENIWHELTSAVRDRQHPFRLPAVATVSPEGEPAVRTVVLRHVHSEQRRVDFYTDARSPKVKHLQHQPRASWHFWDPSRQVQIRLMTQVTLHRDGDAIARQRWENCPMASRLAYAKEIPPGQRMKDSTEDRLPSLDDHPGEQKGQENFVVVMGSVDQIDFYEIMGHRHRRAQWSMTRAGIHGEWIAW
ncbi:pyridoxamine 5'-phosphate oxidase family protein [bacterium]|jgi:pyridoxamine 5'-phosphate oxidase|nr:pyridoxamine 5'-phosphate oxidase family protein [bacterium]